jgi:ABC-type branched-subunit amino acid transport system substrate-binding protein
MFQRHWRLLRARDCAGRGLRLLCKFAVAVPFVLAFPVAGAQAQSVVMIPSPTAVASAEPVRSQAASPQRALAPVADPCGDHPEACGIARQKLSAGLRAAAQVAANGAPADGGRGEAYGGLREASAEALRFGMIAPLSGANKDFGAELKLGAETAFAAANDAGGVNGRMLHLVVADDGYDPARTPEIAKTLVERNRVIGFVGNFGTATAESILPYVLDRKLIFSGAFSGAGVLRRDPPDRYIFNYRASYAEETEAVARYLVKVRRVAPSQIAVFTQDDAFGDAGFAGVQKAMRTLDEAGGAILHLRYARNTIDVTAAIEALKKHRTVTTVSQKKVRERVVVASAAPHMKMEGAPEDARAKPETQPKTVVREKTVNVSSSHPGIRAVIMVATYRAAAKFTEKARELYPDLILTNVSAVGSNNFADELKLLGPRYANGIIVTQVVPDPNGYSSIALEFKSALAKYFPAEHVDYVAFESYINAKIMIEGLKRAGPAADADRLVSALESIRGLDFGLGPTVNYGPSEHQAVHKVWGTQIDETARFRPIDLE